MTEPLVHALINPTDTVERQNAKLLRIAEALMGRVEQVTDDSGAAYAQFQRAAMLEDQVRERTRDLERALDLLNLSNARLGDANRATEAARRNLANAIEAVQEGFALFDPAGALILCNSRFGMHMPDLLDLLKPGLLFDDYVERVSRSRHLTLPDGETPDLWAARRMQQHHQRHVMFNVRMEGDRWVQVSEHRMPDGGTVILQTDVTDIIRLERRERGKLLDDQARIIRATLDHLDQGVCIFDASQTLVGWNQRLGSMLEIPLPRLRLGTEFAPLLHRFSQDARFEGITYPDLLTWAAASNPRAPLRFSVQRHDGPILDVFAQEMPDRGFVISFTDVTAERAAITALSRANETLEARVNDRTLKLEDALATAERANASRSRFVAAASHDLLQPLSAARLFISSIEGETVPQAAQEALSKAQNALESVDSILAALLDISKLDSAKAAVSVGPIDLGAMLHQLSAEFSPLAAAKGLTLHIRPADMTVTSDAAYLRRILQNLIGNALRYTTRGGVLVGLRRRGPMLQLEVWDTGPGIADEDQERIFREFQRLNARASASEGMGLGLAIVERAAALLGHPLGLKSRLGYGTCFWLRIPITANDIDAKPNFDPDPTPDKRILHNRIALLIEPDADLRRAFSLLMEKWGMNVLDCATGEEAFALLEEIGILPDALLFDVSSGQTAQSLSFVQAFQTRYAQIPTCLITTDITPDIENQCRSMSVDLLRKPFDARAVHGFLTRAFTQPAELRG